MRTQKQTKKGKSKSAKTRSVQKLAHTRRARTLCKFLLTLSSFDVSGAGAGAGAGSGDPSTNCQLIWKTPTSVDWWLHDGKQPPTKHRQLN
jgi:hypothetical protein